MTTKKAKQRKVFLLASRLKHRNEVQYPLSCSSQQDSNLDDSGVEMLVAPNRKALEEYLKSQFLMELHSSSQCKNGQPKREDSAVTSYQEFSE